jgi:hypothetical protein
LRFIGSANIIRPPGFAQRGCPEHGKVQRIQAITAADIKNRLPCKVTHDPEAKLLAETSTAKHAIPMYGLRVNQAELIDRVSGRAIEERCLALSSLRFRGVVLGDCKRESDENRSHVMHCTERSCKIGRYMTSQQRRW